MLSGTNAAQIAQAFQNKNIVVIGDIMIDEYLTGTVRRISPEAPVPVVEIAGETQRLGGAANVALNIAGLGCRASIIGFLGADRMGDIGRALLRKRGIATDGLVVLDSRPTTVKTRIIGDNQHITRVDREIADYGNREFYQPLQERIREAVADADAVILEDYNKGTLSKGVIELTISECHKRQIPVAVDPKFINFLAYREVTIFKPNIIETATALARSIENSDEQVEKAGKDLLQSIRAENVLLTRGQSGLTLLQKSGEVLHIPTRARKVADVSGAGDTVISVMLAAVLGGASFKEAAWLANIAAGIVVEEIGIVPINVKKLLESSNYA